MLNIGCHLSTSKGFRYMGQEALSIGANTFQFFSRNPRGSKARTIDTEDVAGLLDICSEHQFAPLLAHAPYTLNPCAANEGTKAFAIEVLEDDLQRMEHLPGNLYNFHPGSHVGQGLEKGIEVIAETLNGVLRREMRTTVLLETMAGKGTEVGSTFEELADIIQRVKENQHMGVCLDTCHVYDAGYDLVQDLDGVLEEFDRIVGLERLRAIHLNDSKNPFESHKDRHEKIGQGSLGVETFQRIINHPQLKGIPFYLETPNELPGYAEEIKLLRSLFEK